MERQCVRCWACIDRWLWCNRCRELVDEEVVERSVSRPLAFYFSNYYMYWYPKKNLHSNKNKHENKM